MTDLSTGTIDLPDADSILLEAPTISDEVDLVADEGVETPGDDSVDSAEAEGESLFEGYDLDQLGKTDPRLKTWAAKQVEVGRYRAEQSYNDKLAHETKQAEAAANAKAIETAFNGAVSQAQDVLGGWAKREFSALLKKVASDGIPDGWDYEAYLGEKTQAMAKAMRLAAVLGTAGDRMKLLAEDFPGYKMPTDLAQQWADANRRQDVLGLDRAYSKAIADAARAAVEAEMSAKSEATAAEAAAATAKAKALRDVESSRNGQTRPVRDVPVASGRLTSADDLDRMSQTEFARLTREKPEQAAKLLQDAEEVERRRAQRARSA